MSNTIRPTPWVSALGTLTLVAAAVAGAVGAGAAERAAAPASALPVDTLTQVHRAASGALDQYVRPGAVAGARSAPGGPAAADPTVVTNAQASAHKAAAEVTRPGFVSDLHAGAVKAVGEARQPGFVSDTVTETQEQLTKVIKTVIPAAE